MFNGIAFRRYPDAKRRSDQVYFVPAPRFREQGVGRLHQEIWKAGNGPIPEGHHIHHRDENPLNNDPSNLECLPGHEHLVHHLAERELTPERIAHMAAIRPLTVEWHRSPEGRAWHREHALRSWAGREPGTRICQVCGGEFETRHAGESLYCGGNCRAQARRLSGVDDETRQCPACDGEFVVNKYARKVCCTRKCAWDLRKRLRAA